MIDIFKKMNDIEKAKILLDIDNNDVARVSKVYNLHIRNITTNMDMTNAHTLEVEMKFILIGDGLKLPQLNPDKQYIIAEVE